MFVKRYFSKKRKKEEKRTRKNRRVHILFIILIQFVCLWAVFKYSKINHNIHKYNKMTLLIIGRQ